jgi:hypothetical protein
LIVTGPEEVTYQNIRKTIDHIENRREVKTR